MAEWVQKGSLKGPQGDPGEGVPEGGTEGQVLTKTADSTAWQDAPEADLTNVMKLEPDEISSGISNLLTTVGEDGQKQYASFLAVVPSDYVGGTYPESVIRVGMTPSGSPTVDVSGDGASISVRGYACSFEFGDKFITGIYDFVDDNAEILVSGKAVKQYVDASSVTYPEQATGQTYAEDVIAASSTASSTPVVRVAGENTYGVVKTASMADFKAYMGIS